MAHASVFRNLSEQLKKAADWAEGKASKADIENLKKVAGGEPGNEMEAYSPRAGYDLLSRVTRFASGALEPKNVALSAGVALANTNPLTGIPVDAALVAHGGYGVVKNAPAAIGGDPEAAERALLGGAEMAGGAAGLGANAKAPLKTGRAGQYLAEKTVAPLARKPPIATMEDLKYGRDPASAIANEGLVAGSRESLVGKINGRLGELSNAADQQLQNHPNANAKIDVEPIIDKNIDAAVKSAKKVGNKAAQARLEDLRTALKTEYGPTQGTPFEINNLKRDIGNSAADLRAFKATDPLEHSAASAMGDIYTDIKNAVNQQVPEVMPLNERMADLLAARSGVQRNIALHINKSPLSVLSPSHLAFKTLEATVGSTPIRTGVARALNFGNVLDVTRVSPVPSGSLPGGPAAFVRQATPQASTNLPGGPAAFTSKAPTSTEPQFAYRVRNQGEEGLPIGGSTSNEAHATTTLEDAQRLGPGRESVTGEKQEITKYDLSKLKEGKDYVRIPRVGKADWIRMLRPLREAELQVVKEQ